MKCGHLFNGIGGFALAAHWMGWENAMHCEIDPFCNKVMKKHFPESYEHTDIRTTDFGIWKGRIDLLTGGFPCKQTSVAAAISKTREGLNGNDSGLWYEYLRAIKEICPAWVVVENVSGVEKWESAITNSLEDIGYTTTKLVFQAEDFGLPHRRRRCIYVSNPCGKRLEVAWQKKPQTIDWFKRLAASGGNWLSGTPGIIGIFNGLPDRVDRVKSLGNAIVPNMAHEVFKLINQDGSQPARYRTTG